MWDSNAPAGGCSETVPELQARKAREAAPIHDDGSLTLTGKQRAQLPAHGIGVFPSGGLSRAAPAILAKHGFDINRGWDRLPSAAQLQTLCRAIEVAAEVERAFAAINMEGMTRH